MDESTRQGCLRAVERKRVAAELLDPEAVLEALPQRLGLALEAQRMLVLAERPGDGCGAARLAANT